MTRPPFDLSLYLVVGSDAVGEGVLEDVVLAAVAGGVTMVQLRDKDASDAQLIECAVSLRRTLAPLDIPLIVNDRLGVAVTADADGLHVGQDDISPADARAALGPNRILGVSAGNPEEAAIVDESLVDYVGVGPVYATGTKPDAGAAIGLAGLDVMVDLLSLPIVAIGGIQQETAAAVAARGVSGIAVVSAICNSLDPEAAARELANAIAEGRREASTRGR